MTDPDRQLSAIEHLAREILTGVYDRQERLSIAEALAERVLELDNWLRENGALPKEWSNERRTDQPARGGPPAFGEVRGPQEGYPPPFTIRRG